MRKQLVIGVSLLTLTGLGGVRANSVQEQSQEAVSTYVHFVRTCQNQTFEPLSGASLAIGLPNRANYQTAGVHFIVSNQGADFGNDDAKNNDFSDPTGETCKNLGYTVTSCETGLFNKACPYNDKIYDRCCDVTYKYTSSQCSSPKKLSSDSCGGKYRCYCDTATYPYASCNDPQIKGSSCTDDSGTRYATCTCPSANNGQWGCKEYYAAPCNSICKTPYADSCHLHESVSTPYGCEKYFEGCSSKCEVAYKDNCRNHDAVISSCPDNASCSYFSDCSSKIQSWSCNSGYEKSGNACVQAIKSRACQYVGDILYGDGTCAGDVNKLDPNKTPIGVVFDDANRLAVALDQTSLVWSTEYVDIPTLGNCSEPFSCSTKGKQNTAAIIAYATSSGKTGKYPAAEYCTSYKPSTVYQDEVWYAEGQWFLPSMKELQTLYNNKAVVNASLQKVNAVTLSSNYYWSSTENYTYYVWILDMNNGGQGYTSKSHDYSVRPVLAF